MMSEYYDHYHRWEPLAEFHFIIDEDEDFYEDDNYVYCLCSRAFIRDGLKNYYAEKEDASESDVEVVKETQPQEWEDQSHVHFSAGTSYKVKCEKDDGASCYCSASHTENCSTDEHDAAQIPGNTSHALQPSDSGADLTYPDYHSESTNHNKLEEMHPNFPEFKSEIIDVNEDYRSEGTWDKFWAINGERIIWASWIKRYSDYINPSYLNDNKELAADESILPKQHSADERCGQNLETANQKNEADENIRERKFSYDSKVNPYKKSNTQNCAEKADRLSELSGINDNTFSPIGRRRSCSEHDRMLSPRTPAATDSMTNNVTKVTFSSFDATSSHVTSESSPNEDYTVTSSRCDNQNDQTRIANVENTEALSEEQDTDQYWQFLWQKHFGEIYALHYANYIEMQDVNGRHSLKKEEEEEESHDHGKMPLINVEAVPETKVEEKVPDIECENSSEGTSQEMPSVIEVESAVEDMTIQNKNEENYSRRKKKGKKTSTKYLDSVGVLLQSLLKEEQKNPENENELFDGNATEGNKDKSDSVTQDVLDETTTLPNVQQSESNSNLNQRSYYNDGDDDPPEDRPVTLKRSHELDEDEISENINTTFQIMGFSTNPGKIPRGKIIYRKRNGRLRPPLSKKIGVPRKTYFDDDGNPCQNNEGLDSQEEREIQTDDDTPNNLDSKATDTTTDNNNLDSKETDTTTDNVSIDTSRTDLNIDNKSLDYESNKSEDMVLEASKVPFPDLDASFSDVQEIDDNDQKVEDTDLVTAIKCKRRQKRYKVDYQNVDISDMPRELADDPKMIKYWKKRHSLFHRFDEGIKLDKESWFSVTPENVARHIATKCTYEVVLDAFCGAGGNTIQFAKTCEKVIAIDIDPAKIEMARHNATVYGVAERIDFMVGDFFEIAPTLEADMVFLSPPWGGPKYSENDKYDIETMLEPRPASELMRVARDINSNVTLYLPRNTRTDQILSLAQEAGGSVEIEQSYLDRRFVAITAYFY